MAKPRSWSSARPGPTATRRPSAAWHLAGAEVETWHVGRMVEDPAGLDAFQVLTLPGGFSYGDDLGAGRILATRLGTVLGDAFGRLLDRGGLVLGICNGFQVLVKAGLLPGGPAGAGPATLTFNDSGHFESRWVRLVPSPASARSSTTPSRSSCPSPTAKGSSSWPTPPTWPGSKPPARSSSATPTPTASPRRPIPPTPTARPAPSPASATPPAGSSA